MGESGPGAFGAPILPFPHSLPSPISPLPIPPFPHSPIPPLPHSPIPPLSHSSWKMKITHCEKWQVVVPCREGVLEREGRWYDPGLSTFDSVPKWIIRLHTDD